MKTANQDFPLTNDFHGSAFKSPSKLTPAQIEQRIREGRDELTREYRLKLKPNPNFYGLVGILNLGNTCFMASILQCLANCEGLTLHLLSSSFEEALNPVNSVTKGKLACEYYVFLKRLWCEEKAAVNPENIRNCIVGVVETFVGYSQQDSQEFLAFFIDSLHEDLNKVAVKPYELLPKYNGQVVEEFGKLIYKYHLKRNTSYIVDAFHGQFFSRLQCPDCQHISASFDPFNMVSLNIPLQSDSSAFDGYIMPFTLDGPTCEFSFYCSQNSKLSTLIDHIFKAFDFINPVHVQPLFYVNTRIIGKPMFPYSMTASKVMLNEGVLILSQVYDPLIMGIVFEDRSEKALIQLKSKIEFTIKISIFDNSQMIGVQRLVVVPDAVTTMDLYLLVYCIYRSAFMAARPVEHNSFKGPSIETRLQLLAEFQSFWPQRTNDPVNSLFTLRVNHEELTKLDDKANLFEFTFENILNVDVRVNTRRFQNPLALKRRAKISIDNLLKQDPAFSLEQCLDHFTSEEILDKDNMWVCPMCRDPKQALKKLLILKSPEVLIIHLKRFKKEVYRNGTVGSIKVTTAIDFPLHNLDLSPYIYSDRNDAKYDLFAVSNHYGSSGSGHYTAFCKNFVNKAWFCFDDTKVTRLDDDKIVSNAAYVLFYRRTRR
jgi:ubiquitin carboxyl-terminal hydrolase 4/11/15